MVLTVVPSFAAGKLMRVFFCSRAVLDSLALDSNPVFGCARRSASHLHDRTRRTGRFRQFSAASAAFVPLQQFVL